ncbi:aminotransferase class III-fold pyridoxal phosphate-dependent enzyme [Leucobacter tenebrionis]|uniref:aminotransferase class III-fold pyridoxal phosphate-dependent enzyme n=1 Tax=Leucobacter tenebrionis TaxID=2873270 RepID=UPI001CA6374B|nr:aminotransferase class III-fold pyridoxal phosphate-dependent enzyme [Leucobacter tenebrionis]QZY51718.1 aminotransferase class III-fold pyridoxal phosphate-dependent enzyme [Leucobacter tenebrionis]
MTSRTGTGQPAAGRVVELLERERELFRRNHPGSERVHREARHLLGGVPFHWIRAYAVPFPIAVVQADGAHLVDVDGNAYHDFGLSGTAAMGGHHGSLLREIMTEQVPGPGVVTGWTTEDAGPVGALLAERYALPVWELALSATEANRAAIRLARAITDRPFIIAFGGAYHGSLEELHATAPGSAPGAGDSVRVLRFNDPEGLARALADRQVAAVIMEPALTNGGGVALPDPEFVAALGSLTREHGTLLIVDETQSGAAGYRGAGYEFGLDPDFITLGKSLAAGLPIGAVGMRQSHADAAARVLEAFPGGPWSLSGYGATVTAGPLTLRAARRYLTEVMTPDVYDRMNQLAQELSVRLSQVLARLELPWRVSTLGAIIGLSFREEPVRDGEDARAPDPVPGLRDYLFISLLNRGVLVGNLGGYVVVSPTNTERDIDAIVHAFEEATSLLRVDE